MISYEEEVKNIYWNAAAEQVAFGYWHIVSGDMGLSDAYESQKQAWESAYKKLKQKGII